MNLSLDTLIQDFLIKLPDFVVALAIFLIGWFVANKIMEYIINFFNRLRLNQMLKSLGWQDFFSRYGAELNFSKLFGIIIKIYFLLLFLIMSLDVLKLTTFSGVIIGIINYFPNIFISIIIFVFAVFLADFSKKILIVSLEKEKIVHSGILGDVLSFCTWILAILAILYQLKIVPELIITLFIGVIAFFVLTFGLSFGLGGKEFAAKILENLEKRLK